MNLILPSVEDSNRIFQHCPPLDFDKDEINIASLKFEARLQEKLLIGDLDGCKYLAVDFMVELKKYLRCKAKLGNSLDALIDQYANRFIDQMTQFALRVTRMTSPLNSKSGCVVTAACEETISGINRLLQPEINFVMSKNPRTDFLEYDRCKIFRKGKVFNFFSKIPQLKKILKQIPEYNKFIFDRGYDLNSFTLHYSTSDDVVHYQLGLWRDEEFRQDSSIKYLQSHYDPDPENIKSLIYLSDVQAKSQGPFKYVDGSHKISEDNMLQRLSGATMCGINLLETNENRMFFAALPSKLMHHNIFGSLLHQDQLDRIKLDDLLLPIYGDTGTIIFFDPLGIHSGGFCQGDGVRLNLQLLFKSR